MRLGRCEAWKGIWQQHYPWVIRNGRSQGKGWEVAIYAHSWFIYYRGSKINLMKLIWIICFLFFICLYCFERIFTKILDHSKIVMRVQRYPIYLHTYTCIGSLLPLLLVPPEWNICYNQLIYDWYLCHNHPKSRVSTRVHAWLYTTFNFGKTYSVIFSSW